jgi:hypothetical protein
MQTLLQTVRKNEGSRMARLNCWEFYTCPKERQETCPAYMQGAGRSCWLVAGTLCGGRVHGTHAKKIGDCQICDFFIRIKASQI